MGDTFAFNDIAFAFNDNTFAFNNNAFTSRVIHIRSMIMHLRIALIKSPAEDDSLTPAIAGAALCLPQDVRRPSQVT